MGQVAVALKDVPIGMVVIRLAGLAEISIVELFG
jgi:hypothetical protein